MELIQPDFGRQRFDDAALTYDAVATVQRDAAAWLAEWIPLERRGDALEIAAGTGLFTRHLLRWRGFLEASDLSPTMVQQGRRKLPAIRWTIRDAASPGLPASLDWLFSCSFLQWAFDPQRLLKTWRRQLRPGGSLLCGMFISDSLHELRALAPGVSPVRWRTEADYAALFGAAGFRVRRIESRSRIHRYPSARGLFRQLHHSGVTGPRQLSIRQMRRLMDDYAHHWPHPDGGVRATWSSCRIIAERPRH